PLHRRRRAPRGAAPARARRPPRRGRPGPAAGRPLEAGGSAGDRAWSVANRLPLLQPDDAGPERLPAHRRRLYAPAREARGHVPADAPRRVCGVAREVSQTRAFGVAAGLDPEIATPLAGRCE